jgi:hypothetical protein
MFVFDRLLVNHSPLQRCVRLVRLCRRASRAVPGLSDAPDAAWRRPAWLPSSVAGQILEHRRPDQRGRDTHPHQEPLERDRQDGSGRQLGAKRRKSSQATSANSNSA